MAIGKAWNLSVMGININCAPKDKLKVKDKKVRDCQRNRILADIKETEDLVDEDKAKELELKKTKNEDTVLENFSIYAKRKMKKEHFNTTINNSQDDSNNNSQDDSNNNSQDDSNNVEKKDNSRVFYHNEKNDNPLEVVGYTNKEEAQKGCESVGAQLASKDQLVEAYSKGVNWCNYGWLKENTEICLPLQVKKYDRLTNKQREMGMCGSYDGAGVNCMKPLKGEKYGAICYSNN